MTTSHEKLIGVLTRYGVQDDIAKQASSKIIDRQALVLMVSGKMGAGKDTVAPPLMEALGFSNKENQSFAAPLKEEVSDVINDIKAHHDEANEELAIRVASNMSVPVDQALFAVSTLRPDIEAGTVKTAYDRTTASRTVLQFWGTQVRRAQDEDYWVRKAVQSVAKSLAQGVSVYVTDARFVNEADAVRQIDGVMVRLDVTEEEQALRIFSRDGIRISEDAKKHVSETALDDYQNFTLRVPTESYNPDQIVDLVVTTIGEVQ